MSKSFYSIFNVIALFALAIVFSGFSSDVINAKINNLSDSEINSKNEITKHDPFFFEEESNLAPVSLSSNLSSNLVFIPSSHDFGKYGEGVVIRYGFQLKNLGATQTSGSVFLYADQPFSCYSGCSSFTLNPNQSHYVYIEFAPCELPYLQEVEFDGTLYANNAQATVEATGYDEVPGGECYY